MSTNTPTSAVNLLHKGFLQRNQADALKEKEFDTVVSDVRELFDRVLASITEYEESCLDGQRNQEADCNFYRSVSQAKSSFGQALMTSFWLKKMFKQDMPNGMRKRLTEEAFDHFVTNCSNKVKELGKELSLSELYGCLLMALKQSFGAKDRVHADELFKISREALNADESLRKFLTKLANSGDYIPAHVWNDLNNGTWVTDGASVSPLSWARGDLLPTIFKEAIAAQESVIDHAAAAAQDAFNREDQVKILDAATGGGKIVKGIIAKLESECVPYSAHAFDSDNDQIEGFSSPDTPSGSNFEVYTQNMAKIPLSPENCGKYDVITQSIGGHHLHPDDQVKMLKNFTHLGKADGTIVLADVYENAIKLLGGLGDDLGSPEHDVRPEDLLNKIELYYDADGNLVDGPSSAVLKKHLVQIGDTEFYPELENHEGETGGLHFVAKFKVVESALN